MLRIVFYERFLDFRKADFNKLRESTGGIPWADELLGKGLGIPGFQHRVPGSAARTSTAPSAPVSAGTGLPRPRKQLATGTVFQLNGVKE